MQPVLVARAMPQGLHIVQQGAQRLYIKMGMPHTSAPAPYIPSGTPHFAYATNVVVGYEHLEACAELGIKPETARHWRKQLQRVVFRFWGRRVSYELAARYAVDAAFRLDYDRFCRENQNSSPDPVN